MAKVLVVEDDPAVQMFCTTLLKREGFEAIVASNGKEGFESFREMSEDIGLVISDIAMPHMDGIELARKILSIDPHASVILMSGEILPEEIPDEIIRVCAFLQKPFHTAEFVRIVKERLQELSL